MYVTILRITVDLASLCLSLDMQSLFTQPPLMMSYIYLNAKQSLLSSIKGWAQLLDSVKALQDRNGVLISRLSLNSQLGTAN